MSKQGILSILKPRLKGKQGRAEEKEDKPYDLSCYHLISALPQVKPPPKTGRQTR
jgi:hypothetical protein